MFARTSLFEKNAMLIIIIIVRIMTIINFIMKLMLMKSKKAIGSQEYNMQKTIINFS